jgi:O-6-methylguanine DNA methyltransferase
MAMIYDKYVSPFGIITFGTFDEKLVHMTFSDDDVQLTHTPFHQKVIKELDAYFTKKSDTFTIDVSFNKGTAFQKAVWQRLLMIPYGKTKSYQDIAQEVNSPKAFRAVGQACKHNPIGLIVPCHRVIGKDGSMTGYSGKDYVDLKQKIILFEKEGKL